MRNSEPGAADTGPRPGPDPPERRGQLSIVIAAVALGLALLGPLLLVPALLWAVDGSWTVDGVGLRYWVLVKGSRLERLGAVEATGFPSYQIDLEDGTFPGWRIARYQSRATPDAVVAAYAQRCREMDFKVAAPAPPAAPPAEPRVGAEARLACEIEPYLDVQVHAERQPGDPATRVVVRVWGSE